MFMKPPEGGTPNRELPVNALSCKRLKCYGIINIMKQLAIIFIVLGMGVPSLLAAGGASDPAVPPAGFKPYGGSMDESGQRSVSPVIPPRRDPGVPAPPTRLRVTSGQRLLGQNGVFQSVKKGWTFLYQPEDGPKKPIRLAILPSRELEQLEEDLKGQARSPAVVSGLILCYRHRAYLLLNFYRIGGQKASEAPKPVISQTKKGKPKREAEQVFEALKSWRPSAGVSKPRATTAPETSVAAYPSVAAPSASSRQWRQGDTILDRRGWIVPAGTDETTGQPLSLFVFISDAAVPSDPPLRLLGCPALEEAEDLAAKALREVSFCVSGRVTTYRGRCYLLCWKADAFSHLGTF